MRIVSRLIVFWLIGIAGLGVLILTISSWGQKTPKWIGRYLMLAADSGIVARSPAEQQRLAESAVGQDSATPSRWCDLAEAYEEAGKSPQAAVAMERAVELGEWLPPVLIRSVNLSFRQGDYHVALRRAARVLDQVSVYDDVIFGMYRRMGVNAEDVVRDGLPESRRAYESYFLHLLRDQDDESAGLIWATIVRNDFQTVTLCSSYIDYLVKLKLYDKSAQIWAGCRGGGESKNGQTNYLFNGGFEREFSGVAFDWRVRPIDGVSVTRAPDPRGNGFALCVKFAGERNLVFRHVEQLAYLTAGRYRLRATAKADALSTDRGVYLAADDIDTRRRYALTKELVGTGDWWELSTEFTVPGRGAMVRVSICRDESLRIDSKIGGTVWLDDVVLEKR